MLAAKGITASLSHTIVDPTNTHPIRTISFRIEQPSVRLDTLHLSMVAPTGAAAALAPGLKKAASIATREPFNEGLSGLTLQDILLSSVRSAGYIQSTLDNLQRTLAPSPTDSKAFLVTYTARVVTGDPYTISRPHLEPHALYSAADFTRDAKLHSGDIANGSDLTKTQDAISAAYLSHGYLDVYVLAHSTPDATAHTVAYTLEPIPATSTISTPSRPPAYRPKPCRSSTPPGSSGPARSTIPATSPSSSTTTRR